MPQKIILSHEQSKAIAPTMNIVVQANAGTGKTFVLIQRLLRLLFREFNPDIGNKSSGILCLTYTNAAAAEMRNRILDSMISWATATDDELKEILIGIAHNNPVTDEDIKTARQIFYNFIDNPSILKIQTIHSFSEDILRRFSIEANVPPAWRLVSGAEQKRLLKDAFKEMLNSAQPTVVQNAFDYILDKTSENSLDDLLQSILSQYKSILSLKHNDRFLDQIIEKTKKFLQVDVLIQKPDFNGDILDVLTKEGEIRKKLSPELMEIANSVRAYDQYQKNMEIFDISRDFLILCNAFADKYIELKNLRGLLDFDDMLYKTKRLFSNRAIMGQVLSQLDFNLKHILVDESQDNSPIMWDIIFSMLDDFWSDGDIKNPRTLFVVGDIKQSIFSFQGANPEQFKNIKDKIEAQTKNNMRQYDTVPLIESRRTTQAVLSVVDFFFNETKLLNGSKSIHHETMRKNEFGLVEIAPLFIKNYGEESSSVQKRFIKGIADKIESLIKNENIKPGDIMILLQRREPFGPMIISELKQRNILTAGSDRIILPNFPAIRDLLNVIRFAINPNYNAALAFVLRSPIFRLTEKELYNIAGNRDSKIPLIEVVRIKNIDVYNELISISSNGNLGPYSFLSIIMNKYRGQIISAMGTGAIEPLDEFMTLALSYERTQSGGLSGFLRWFLDGENEIKRDMEKGNGVRILTAHSSKGLEAPVVFLIDTTRNPKSQTKNLPFNVLIPKDDVFLCKAGDIDSDNYQNAKEFELLKRTNEYWRLFYVAMTRARDRLYVYGLQERSKNDSWHSLIYEIVSKMPGAAVDSGGIITVQSGEKTPKIESEKSAKQADSSILTIPNKLLNKLENISKNEGSKNIDINAIKSKKYGLTQGTNIHKVLETLDLNDGSAFAVKINQNPEIKMFWAPGSKAELPIAGMINGKFYSLRIDRLIETQDSVLFLDYKTDLTKDRRSEYIDKMKKYAALLSEIFPKKQIIGNILWLHDFELEKI